MKISANGLEISSSLLFAVKGSLHPSTNVNFLQRQQYLSLSTKCVNGSSRHFVFENSLDISVFGKLLVCVKGFGDTFAECGNFQVLL